MVQAAPHRQCPSGTFLQFTAADTSRPAPGRISPRICTRHIVDLRAVDGARANSISARRPPERLRRRGKSAAAGTASTRRRAGLGDLGRPDRGSPVLDSRRRRREDGRRVLARTSVSGSGDCSSISGPWWRGTDRLPAGISRRRSMTCTGARPRRTASLYDTCGFSQEISASPARIRLLFRRSRMPP